jgi:anti-anti-sigma factor
VLALYPLINEGQWGNVSEVGGEIVGKLKTLRKPALVIDLSPLEYMGSAQVALLVRIWKSLKQINGRMVVQCPGEMVREVLALAGLRSLWNIVDTREAALKSLSVTDYSTESSVGSLSGSGSKMGLMTLVISLVAVAAGGGLLGLKLQGSTALEPKLQLALGFVFAVVGLLAAQAAIFFNRGIPRIIAILVILACLGIGVGLFMQL